MQLIFFRHGIAEDRETFKGDDFERPLTEEGNKRTKKAIRGLARLVPAIDIVFSSPLIRALQTATLLQKQYMAKLQKVDVLTPTANEREFLEFLNSISKESVVALVGHEPNLSAFISKLIGGATLELKKAGAAVVEWKGGQNAQLLGLYSPKGLRRMVNN